MSFALVVLMLVLMGRNGSAGDIQKTTDADKNLTLLQSENHPQVGTKTKIAESAPLTAQVNQTIPEAKLVIIEPVTAKTDAPVEPIYTAQAANSNYIEAQPAKTKTVAAPAGLTVNGSAALVAELNGKIIFKKNPTERWPMASLSKLMTAVIASEKLSPDQKITLTEADIATAGDSGDFKVGETYAATDLIKASLLVSSNDAAMALTNAYGYRDFIDLMQAKAAGIGMDQTVYFEPTGLSALNKSTLVDLNRLMSFIFENHPELLKITTQRIIPITELQSNVARNLTSNNNFAGRPDFLGGKTGYTDESNGNLISLFNSGGRRILIMIFGTNDRFGETEKLLEWTIQ